MERSCKYSFGCFTYLPELNKNVKKNGRSQQLTNLNIHLHRNINATKPFGLRILFYSFFFERNEEISFRLCDGYLLFEKVADEWIVLVWEKKCVRVRKRKREEIKKYILSSTTSSESNGNASDQNTPTCTISRKIKLSLERIEIVFFPFHFLYFCMQCFYFFFYFSNSLLLLLAVAKTRK